MPATQRIAPAHGRRTGHTTLRSKASPSTVADVKQNEAKHRNSDGQSGDQREVVRPFVRRWITAGMLLLSAALAVVYIANAIAVNDILEHIASLEREGDIVRVENERLRADLLKLMSVDRVTTVAASRLGMVQPAQPPVSLPVAAPPDVTGRGKGEAKEEELEAGEQPAGR